MGRPVLLGASYPTIEVELGDIDTDSFPNIRTRANADDFQALVENIRQQGRLLQDPILRSKSLDTIDQQEHKKLSGDPDIPYELIAGFRRIAALRLLSNELNGDKYTKLTAKLAQVSDQEARWIQLSENLVRSKLHFGDELSALSRFEDVDGFTSEEIADRLGLERGWVAQRLSFRRFAVHELIAAVCEDILPFTTAYGVMRQLRRSLRLKQISEEECQGKQIAAVDAARQATAAHLTRNAGKPPSARIRLRIAGHAARKALAAKKDDAVSAIGVLSYREVKALLDHLDRSGNGHGPLSPWDDGIRVAFHTALGSPNGKDLLAHYGLGQHKSVG